MASNPKQVPNKKQQLEYARFLAADQTLTPDQRLVEFEKYKMGGVQFMGSSVGAGNEAPQPGISDNMKAAITAAQQRRAIEDSIRSKIWYERGNGASTENTINMDKLRQLGFQADPQRETQEGPAIGLPYHRLTTEEMNHLNGLEEERRRKAGEQLPNGS